MSLMEMTNADAAAPTAPKKPVALKDQLKAMPRGRPQPVDMSRFPDWPQDQVFIRPPSAADLAVWENDGINFDKKGRPQIVRSKTRKATLVQMTLCHENGDLIFEPKDIGDISRMDSPVVAHWYDLALDVSGQRRRDDDDDEDREELEGN